MQTLVYLPRAITFVGQHFPLQGSLRATNGDSGGIMCQAELIWVVELDPLVFQLVLEQSEMSTYEPEYRRGLHHSHSDQPHPRRDVGPRSRVVPTQTN